MINSEKQVQTSIMACDRKTVWQPFFIGHLRIKKPLVLAPMAEYSHVAFRQLVALYGGCGLFYSEMINVRRVYHERHWANPLYAFQMTQHPFFYQLLGHDAQEIVQAIELLSERTDNQGAGPDGFDINMGCSAPLVRKHGSGVSLMKDIKYTQNLIRVCRRATPLPLTAKIRLGWELDDDHFFSFCCMLQDEGIDAIIIHPRLAKEKFRGYARWRYIALIKEKLTVPIIGNGDILSVNDINARFMQTQCDAIMIGRGAIQQPWIFNMYENAETIEVDPYLVLLLLINFLQHWFKPHVAVIRLKQFMKYYAKNFKFGHQLYCCICRCQQMSQIQDIIRSEKERHEKGL